MGFIEYGLHDEAGKDEAFNALPEDPTYVMKSSNQ